MKSEKMNVEGAIEQLEVENDISFYNWQKEGLMNYFDGSPPYEGTAAAVMGSGKTLFGLAVVELLGAEKVLVTSHRTAIFSEWKEERSKFDICSNVRFDYETLHVAHVEEKMEGKHYDLMIVDEAHRSTSEEFVKVYDAVDYDNILGLTATPDRGTIDNCGDVIAEADYSEAKVAPFNVIFHGVKMTKSERKGYRKMTDKMSKLFSKRDKASTSERMKDIQKSLDYFIHARRDLVYRMDNRIKRSADLIEEEVEEGRKVLVFSQRQKQTNEIAKELKSRGWDKDDYIVYHSSYKDDISRYRSGEVSVCLSVMMLTEGFNDVDTDTVIVTSTATTESFHIQSLGRAIRWKEDKHARIHVLLGKGTTDRKVLSHALEKEYDYELRDGLEREMTKVVHSRNTDGYHKGEKYSFNPRGEAWITNTEPREYVEYHDIFDKALIFKPKGGRLSVNDDGVFIKSDEGDYIQLSEYPVSIDKKDDDSFDLSEEWTAEDDKEFIERITGEEDE